jgi:hypothetical protein
MSKTKKKNLIEIELTMQEIWQHTMPKVEKNKKKYERKNKHKNKIYDTRD